MFFSFAAIEAATVRLRELHPFFGTTFLVCKRNHLPVGETREFAINALEEEFLNLYFRPDEKSEYYYQVFKPGKRDHLWLASRYPSTGSQSVRTRGPYAEPFLHPRGTSQWGWRPNYVAILSKRLAEASQRIPAFELAIWLYRKDAWDDKTTPAKVRDRFFHDFNVSARERETLFDTSVPGGVAELFSEGPVAWEDLREITGLPPDASPDEGGTLGQLETVGIGPAARLEIEPATRLTLIVGDNGLGKTFLLDCAWWALTGEWAGMPAYPRRPDRVTQAQITFEITAARTRPQRMTIPYNWRTQSWMNPEKRPTIPGLCVYARVDGSFAVWDPMRLEVARVAPNAKQSSLLFTRDEVWRGQDGLIEGLVRDLVRWQLGNDQTAFNTFSAVLRRLSPSDLGPLVPGTPVRLPGFPQEIPTLRHPFGEVPILLASAGVKRIVGLAYLVVWAWIEHNILATQAQRGPQRQLVVLVDEMEAHLHPQWQRVVLPALLEIQKDLSDRLATQLIVATHSPLVLASAEPSFDQDRDKLYHFGLINREEVRLEELPFFPQGPVDTWLTSPVFGLRQPRAVEAERVLEAAKHLQAMPRASKEEVRRITEDLTRYLSPEDEFWPRWILFAEKHGVKL